jgi:hypothetical protein
VALRTISIGLSLWGASLALASLLLTSVAIGAAPPGGSPKQASKQPSKQAADKKDASQLAGTSAAGASKGAGSTKPEAKHVPILVRKLGDKSYATREAATHALAQVGVPAKAALLEALKDPDAEIRYRAKLVLAEVLEADWRNRLEDFVADTKGVREHDLPGWERFRKTVGDNITARRLFADMQRNEPGLLEASEMGAEFTGEAVAGRCQQIQEARREPGRSVERKVPSGSIAALLFVSAKDDVPISTQAVANLTNLCYDQDFRRTVTGGDTTASPMKKLLADWVSRSFGSDSTATYQTMMLALQLNMREAIAPALLILKDGGTAPHMRQYAVLVVGRFGGPEHIAQLEPLLADSSVCAQQQMTANKVVTIVETQIRDVALAVMVHLSNQKLPEFGFARAQVNAMVLYNTASLGFAKAEDREAALRKWQAFRAQQAQARKS